MNISAENPRIRPSHQQEIEIMSPSLTFSPSPTIKELDACSAIKCNNNRQLSQIGNIKIDIPNINSRNVQVLDEKVPQKFSKFTKVKGYFCQIGLFVLELFIAFFSYVFGIALFLNVLSAAVFSWTLRLGVKLIFATCYYPGHYKIIERGADALWAVESGIGASSSNIVIGLKCKGSPNLEKIVRTFETKVLNFMTSLRVKKINGTYVQEETGDVYEPYQNLRWIIVEKFLFFCMKKDTTFCIENHFSLEEIENENDSLDDGVRSRMEKCITTRMSPDKPQWRFQVVTKPQKQISSTRGEIYQPEYGIIFTIHHSYGDAISWVQMFRYAFADFPVKPSIDPMGKSPSLSSHYFSSSEPLTTRILRWTQTILLFPHYFARQMVYVWREANFFHGPFVKNNGTCRWDSSLSMKQIKAIRVPIGTHSPSLTDTVESTTDFNKKIMMMNNSNNKMGVTSTMKPAFTALLSSCITGAFTKLFRDYQARVPGKLLAILPYADLPYKTLHPLNNFYSHFLPMPTSVTNARSRLVKCDKYTKSFNPPPTKPVNTVLAHLCGIMVTPLQKLVGISARSSVAFSNVPGPAEKIKLFGGDEVTNLILFPPLKYRTAIVVGFISYGDQLTMSLCVDATIPNHSRFASRFVEYFQEELQALIELGKLPSLGTSTSSPSSPTGASGTTVSAVKLATAPLGMQSIERSGDSEKALMSGKLGSRNTSGTPATSRNAGASSLSTSLTERDFAVSIQKDVHRQS